MSIPKIIHQTWKRAEVPQKWISYQQRVKEVYPDWEYILWTDKDNEDFVRDEYPDFYDTYINLPKNIMRADVIRYLIMYKMGGLYLDLDYEILKPFDFSNSTLVLPKNRSKKFGDDEDQIGNCIFASVPKHKFWKDVIDELQENPPTTNSHLEVMDVTGPKFISRIFYAGQYENVEVPERLLFHPPLPRTKRGYNMIRSNNTSYGIHHCWGSWIERFSWAHIKNAFKNLSLSNS